MVVSQLMDVGKIEENSWNANRMPPEKWEALLEDMRKGGPTAIDSILIMSKRVIVPDAPKDSFITVDGNHRLRGARKLRWPKIHAIFDATITSEEQARLISYAKNYERGNLDPYKQAEYFKWFVDHGWKHEEIAKTHRIDRTTVTKVLSLLKIAPDVKAKLADVPYITISHLEPIATAPHHIQRKVAKHINKRDHSTVADITRCTRHITEEFEKREKLRKAVEKAKFPKCPKCGKSPNDFDYTYAGRKNEDNVRCENWHRWSLSKGLELRPQYQGSGEPSEPTIPQSIKSKRAMSDFRAAFNTAISELLPTISNITDIEINSSGKIEDIHIAGQAGGKIRQVVTAMLPSIGKIEHIHVEGKIKSGKAISLSVTLYDWSLEFGVERQSGKNYNLKISKAKIKDHPELRTRVGLWRNRIVSKEDLSKLELQVRDLFQEYGDDSMAVK